MSLEQFTRRAFNNQISQNRDEECCKPGEVSKPEQAFDLRSIMNQKFTLVREAEQVGREGIYPWYIWYDGKCVGRIELAQLSGAYRISENAPFSCVPTRIAREQLLHLSYCRIGQALRRQGFMLVSLRAITRELSSKGQVLASKPNTRNKMSRGLWKRLVADPQIQAVQRRSDAGTFDYALILETDLGIA